MQQSLVAEMQPVVYPPYNPYAYPGTTTSPVLLSPLRLLLPAAPRSRFGVQIR